MIHDNNNLVDDFYLFVSNKKIGINGRKMMAQGVPACPGIGAVTWFDMSHRIYEKYVNLLMVVVF